MFLSFCSNHKKFFYCILFFLFFSVLTLVPESVLAVELSVEAPQETLQIGQVFDFIVNIDTEGESITKQEFYIVYEDEYLELQSGGVYAGDFFENVQYSPVEAGKIYVVATNSTPKSGTGTVAIVKFKIIAEAPGSAVLCAVLPITPTPTIQPTTPQNTPLPTSTPVPGTTVYPTPTALPQSGSVQQVLMYSFIAFGFILIAGALRMI